MDRPSPPLHELRDPIHGAIPIDPAERRVVEHRAVQRLRNIRQLGFSHLPFPSATHTRFAHCLGAMHLAGRAFDNCFRDQPFSSGTRRRAFRHCVRLAALCHDLGHAPYSHAAEFAMPPLRELGIAAYDSERVAGRLGQRAHHEDYTVAILTRSSLATTIRAQFPFGPEHVAALVSPDVRIDDDFFFDGGFDLRPVLSQMVTGDIDVDRLDYLLRDAYFTGARYGEVDVNWLLSHLTRSIDDQGRVCLALDRRALYAFDDFLVARQHMFLMVYFHRKSVVYEELFKRFVRGNADALALPADAEAYLQTDDAWMWGRLRAVDDPWARRIIEFRPYKVAFEAHLAPEACALQQRVDALRARSIDAMATTAHGSLLSKPDPAKPTLWCVDRTGGELAARPMLDVARDLHAGAAGVTISRIYVRPDQRDAAREVVKAVWEPQQLQF